MWTMGEECLCLELVFQWVVSSDSFKTQAGNNLGWISRFRFTASKCSFLACFPKFDVRAASILNFRVKVGENDFNADGNRRWLFAFVRGRYKIISIVEVELFNWWEAISSVRAKHQIERFADGALAHIIWTDNQSMAFEMQFGRL